MNVAVIGCREQIRLKPDADLLVRATDRQYTPPGLWLGNNLLDQQEVFELAHRLLAWGSTGSLRLPNDPK